MAMHTNRLAGETSPYLLQHAHNPVDWYPWGEEALQKAKDENKPILVSIGYAACHWCHVMERESFESEETAALMNRDFVNIKIDREERPDLDHIYMDAVQTMTGSGGWPLNVFLTPEGKPFYGGTYFPPAGAYNRPSWAEVLLGVAKAFKERRPEMDAQAEKLTRHLMEANAFGTTDPQKEKPDIFDREKGRLPFEQIMKVADRTGGGFGGAPKFPQTFVIRYLLHYHYYTGNEEALQQACLSLDKMIDGGICDQVGGGWARYATDNEWLVPHFEKMLYDNALLVDLLAEAYQLTGKSSYATAIRQALAFVQRELLSPEGGFYAALDADSEGVEGKFYVWQKQELDALLGEDAALFCEYYDITEAGNWEHTNILHVTQSIPAFAAARGLSVEAMAALLKRGRETLLEHRSARVRPALDDKILLGWNALMNTAFVKAWAALGENACREQALANMQFLQTRLRSAEGKWHHTYKSGRARVPAFLEDYAFLIRALIHLQEMTGDEQYLWEAKALTREVIERFSEEGTDYFCFTPLGQADVILRKKELYDGATPSGNAMMAMNLYYLGVVFDEREWQERAIRLSASTYDIATRYPTSFGVWATFIQALSYGIPEIVLLGHDIQKKHHDLLKRFIPFKIYQSATRENDRFPLLAGKKISPEGMIFLCRQYECQNPVNEVDALIPLLKNV